jgi:hypothetical protein
MLFCLRQNLANPAIPNKMSLWLSHSATRVEPCAPNQKRPKSHGSFDVAGVCLTTSVDS